MKLEPYHYFALAKAIDDLINVYQSVNDKQTVNAVQALTTEKINEILTEDSTQKEELLQFILDPHLTKASAFMIDFRFLFIFNNSEKGGVK